MVDWTGKGDGHSWEDADNWSTQQVPGRDDEVTIARAFVDTAGATVKKLRIAEAVIRYGPLEITDELTLDIVDPTLGIFGPVVLGAAAKGVWTGGWLENVDVSAGAELRVEGDTRRTTRGLVIDGTLVLAGRWVSLIDNGLVGRGVVRVEGRAGLCGGANIDITGRLEIVGEATLSVDAAGGNVAPALILHPESTLDLGAGVVELRSGNAVVEAGATITGTGTLRAGGGPGPASLQLDGGAAGQRGAHVELTVEGILRGLASFGVADVSWIGGTILDRLTVAHGATLEVSGPHDKIGNVVVVDGKAVFRGGGKISLNGGLVNHGEVLIDADTSLSGVGGIQNSGVIKLARPDVTLRFDRGEANVEAPLRQAASGSIEMGGGTVWLRGTASAFETGTRILGPGTLRVGGGDGPVHLSIEGPIFGSGGIVVTIDANSYLKGQVEFRGANVEWVGGDIDHLIIPRGATLAVCGTDPKSVRMLAVDGTATLAPSNLTIGQDGLRVDGLLELSGIIVLPSSGEVVNHGTIRLQPAATVLIDTCEFDSDGVLDLGTRSLTVRPGRVELQGRFLTTVKGSDVRKHDACGQLLAEGALTLSGEAVVTLSGALPSPVVAFPIVRAGALTGGFDTVSVGWRADRTATAGGANDVLLRQSSALPSQVHARRDPGWSRSGDLQTRLQLAHDAVKASAPSDWPKGGVALVDLTSSPGSVQYAAIDGDLPCQGASLAKLAVLISAYQLRADLRALAVTIPTTVGEEGVYARAEQVWGLGANRGPRLNKVFVCDNSAGAWDIDFASTHNSQECLEEIDTKLENVATRPQGMALLHQLGFAERMRLMGSWSENFAATSCIQQISIEYICSVMQDLGLYDAAGSAGIWLGGEYGKISPPWGVHGPLVPDPACPAGKQWKQDVTALALARLMVLLLQGSLVDGEADLAVLGVLDKSHGMGTRSFFQDGLEAAGVHPALYSKIGILGSVCGEVAAVTGRVIGTTTYSYVAVALGGSDEGLQKMITILEGVLTGSSLPAVP